MVLFSFSQTAFLQFVAGHKADEAGDGEGAPGFLVDVVEGDGGEGFFLRTVVRSTRRRQVIAGDKELVEGAFGLADRAVFFKEGEGDDAGFEGFAEVVEIPGIADHVGPLEVRAVSVQDMRHMQDAGIRIAHTKNGILSSMLYVFSK